MQTQPEPPPSPSSAESAVGLTFVAIVLVSLFAAGSLGVVMTLDSAPSPGTAQQPEVTAVAAAHPAGLSRGKTPPAPAARAPPRPEIPRLRASGRGLDALRLPVKVFDAFRPGNRSWVVVAR